MTAVATGVRGGGRPGGAVEVLRRGWRASPELRVGFAGTVALALVGGLGRLAVPVLVQQLLDRGLADGERPTAVVPMAALAALVVLVAVVAVRTSRARLALASERALEGLRLRAFRHIHQLSLAHHTGGQRGELVSRVTSDVETLSQFVAWGGMAWLVNGAVMLAVFATMLVYDWRLALVVVLVLTPMTVVLRVFQRRLLSRYDEMRTRFGHMLGAVGEAVTGAAVVRSYGVQARTTARVDRTVDATRGAAVRAARVSSLLFPTYEVFSALSVAAVIALGVAFGPDAGLTAGQLVAFAFLVSLFLEPVGEFTDVLDTTQQAVAGWRKVLDLLATPVGVVPPEAGVDLPPGPPTVTLEHVSFAYGPELPLALRDVTLTISAGTHVALVGETGSGKSTMAGLLTRMADPTEGRVVVGGVDLREADIASLRSTVVLVPQDGFLFDETVAQNVRRGRPGSGNDGEGDGGAGDEGAGDEEVASAFARLGLASWVDGLPEGLDTPVGERGDRLSVGERQLVCLARAALSDPGCLILDEATSAVDPATEVRLARAVERLTGGRTSVTIAHRLATAERADLVLVLEGGRLVEQGTSVELLTRGGAYARLHQRWMAGTDVAAAS